MINVTIWRRSFSPNYNHTLLQLCELSFTIYILALKEIVDEETSIFFVTDLAMYMNRHMFICTGVYFTCELLTLYTNMTAGDSGGVPVHLLGHTV